MLKLFKCTFLFLLLILLFNACGTGSDTTKKTLTLNEKTDLFVNEFNLDNLDFEIPPYSKIDSIEYDLVNDKIIFHANKYFAYIPFRNEHVEKIYNVVSQFMKPQGQGLNYQIKVHDYAIEDLIPNFYRDSSSNIDENRVRPKNDNNNRQVIKNISKPYKIEKGLNNRNIALWHSHGWYYSHGQKRWEWQRPRLFQSVEDLIPIQFTIPFIIPMLENAGANVYVPRERDTQRNEIVIDNDSKDQLNSSYFEKFSKANFNWETDSLGFAYGNPPYEINFNPFLQGTSRFTLSDTAKTAYARWVPNVPESGKYAVYISYEAGENNVEDAHYIVNHLGGKTEFEINQKIGGSSWYYLGTFKFAKGQNENIGSVVLTNESKDQNLIVSADAVRFGGGMGIVKRNGSTSGRPKYIEAARYYLQYAGMPDTLVYNLNNNENDYSDDYQSRGEYVNYLMGKPFGPNKNRDYGLGIPIDLSMAFHTDAGITNNEKTIGTLGIYSIPGFDERENFPDDVSRLANRDLTDIIQTQIVDDIRLKYNPTWNRRALRNANYSEAFRPNTPAILLELLSHQNFADMKYMLDPGFRFTVSRAIYKGMLKFLSVENNKEYVVQPLPVTHMQAEFISNNEVKVSWKPQKDNLEPTADADGFVVYTRIEKNGFNNGVYVGDSSIVLEIPNDEIISFKVAAVNKGGESFPSEILSVCRKSESNETVLIVNGFDRISGPENFRDEVFSGFLGYNDNGVPYKYDLGFTGYQYDFQNSSKFLTNDAPGHGASYANFETKLIAGNTFDFPFVHGSTISNAGYSFVSCSDEAVEDSLISLNNYKVVDFIFGEEKTTPSLTSEGVLAKTNNFVVFSEKLKSRITDYTNNKGNLFISGAYLGTDLYQNDSTLVDKEFAENILKFRFATDHAAKTGKLLNEQFSPIKLNSFTFCTELNENQYAVESPDALDPVNGSVSLIRYYDNSFSAGTFYSGDYKIISLGFPFESIKEEKYRNQFMTEILRFFEE